MSVLRTRYVKLLVLVVIGSFDGYAIWQWIRVENDVNLVRQLNADCELLAQRIGTLRESPTQVQETLKTNESVAQLVESVAGSAGLSADRIVHVAPTAPRRLADSSYTEQATEIELREVSLQQLIQLAIAIPRTAPGMHVPRLVMRTPPPGNSSNESEPAGELWNVQMTLTSITHQPTIPHHR